MKQFCAAFIALCSLLRCDSALAEHPISVCGMVNIPGRQVAFLKIDRENWVVQTGDRLHCESGNSPFQVDVVEVDLTNEIVKTSIDGNEFTNNFLASPRPASANTWIRVQNADFKAAMDLYSFLSGRVNLIHPAASFAPFSCDATWTNSSPSKTEMMACLTGSLTKRGMTSLEDGDHFLQILPTAIAQSALLGAKDLPTTKSERLEPGAVDFEGILEFPVIDIYGKLLGRTCNNAGILSSPSDIFPYFRTTQPLSKSEITYALETLFRWNGIKIILNADNTFSVAKISQPAK